MFDKMPILLGQIKKTKALQLMLIPGLIYYLVFHYVPIYGLIIAFKDFNLRLGILGSQWIGLDNFKRFFNYVYFFRLVKNTFVLNLYSLLWGFPMPIILALFLNEVKNLFFKRFVQTVSYLPHFISTVAIVGMLYMILSPSTGIVNRIIMALGGESIYFVADKAWFRTLYIGSGIWQSVGWGAIIYLAALSGVSDELHEAAVIDGASRVQRIFHISLPSIMPTIVIMLILNIGSMMSSSTEKVLLLYQPNTYEVSDVLGTYVYRMGLGQADYGFGTAAGLFNSVINLALLILANSISKKLTEKGLW
ncbi:MAG: ABC transporter permease subunit [Treponema sp.]|jgi:putative aldouronate transport system permease protein|nr:ABC transporter permease subunit [Treponema sp.]